jgi:flagellar biosynthesis protein FlhG
MTVTDQQEGQQHRPRIWAIGGGKGGVGKSVIASGLAMSLAARGERCILFDADLGGANLHTFVGMPNPQRTISDLFRRAAATLDDILLPTPFPNLSLISGARAQLDMANPAWLQKVKLIRQLTILPADHIFIDLGAGSSFNMLDFFLAAQNGLLVLMPTPTAIENTYHFLKASYYRRLRSVIRHLEAEDLVDAALATKVQNGVRSPRELLLDLQQRDPQVAQRLQRAMARFTPKLVVNQVQRSEDRELGAKMVIACRDFFGIDMGEPALIRNDERVLVALKSRRPVLEMFPGGPFAEDIRRLLALMLPAKEASHGQR